MARPCGESRPATAVLPEPGTSVGSRPSKGRDGRLKRANYEVYNVYGDFHNLMGKAFTRARSPEHCAAELPPEV